MTGVFALIARSYFLTEVARKISSIETVVFENEEYTFNRWIQFREYKLKTRIVNAISNLKAKVKYDRGHNTRMYSKLEEYVPLALSNSHSWIIDNIIPKIKKQNNENFYIRTETPNQYQGNVHDIELVGIDSNTTLKTEVIIENARPLGSFMMECAGNDRYSKFRLLSVANWSGVPLKDLLEKDVNDKSLFGTVKIDPSATHLLIEGFDDSTNTKWNRIFGVESTPGASWIFSVEELINQNAFLATEMNNEKLTMDHGFPVRLIVPGYYGCASIKWVNKMSFFTPETNTPTEDQMREFSDRTGQVGIPKRFENHKPPVVELSAVPVTIEKWKSKTGKVRYKIIGMIWGGIHEVDPSFNIVLRKTRDSRKIILKDKLTLGPRNPNSFQHWEYWLSSELSGSFFVDVECRDEKLAASRLKSHYYRRVLRI
jgi:hypothetical protein